MSSFVKTMFQGHKPINYSILKQKKEEDEKPKVKDKKTKLTGKVTIIRF